MLKFHFFHFTLLFLALCPQKKTFLKILASHGPLRPELLPPSQESPPDRGRGEAAAGARVGAVGGKSLEPICQLAEQPGEGWIFLMDFPSIFCVIFYCRYINMSWFWRYMTYDLAFFFFSMYNSDQFWLTSQDLGRVHSPLRRESSCSVSSDDWAGGLRSCASGSSSSGFSGFKGKGKGTKGSKGSKGSKGKGGLKSFDGSSDSDLSSCQLLVGVTTSLEVPLSVLRSSWKAAVAEASSAQIEVDASRRDGFGRLIIVGSWRQSLLAYQCLMELFGKASSPEETSATPETSRRPRVWRGKLSKV